MEFPEIELETIAAGAAPALFKHELQKILDNMADTNTDPTAKRVLTLKFTFEQDADRQRFAAFIEPSLKLAATRVASTICYTGNRKGRNIAVESNPNQVPLRFDEPVPSTKPTAS